MSQSYEQSYPQFLWISLSCETEQLRIGKGLTISIDLQIHGSGQENYQKRKQTPQNSHRKTVGQFGP